MLFVTATALTTIGVGAVLMHTVVAKAWSDLCQYSIEEQ